MRNGRNWNIHFPICTQPIPSSWQNGLPPALATDERRGGKASANAKLKLPLKHLSHQEGLRLLDQVSSYQARDLCSFLRLSIHTPPLPFRGPSFKYWSLFKNYFVQHTPIFTYNFMSLALTLTWMDEQNEQGWKNKRRWVTRVTDLNIAGLLILIFSKLLQTCNLKKAKWLADMWEGMMQRGAYHSSGHLG